MEFDLFSLEPTKISRDLRGKYLLLYGQPKCGKTSFAVKAPKNLLMAFEMGYNALGGIMAVPIQKWSEFRKYLKQLERPEMMEKFNTITIDTATIAYDKCEEYICNRENVENLTQIPWGAGYTMVKKEFESCLRKITMLGYGLILIAHAEEKTIKQGSDETIIRPLLNKRAYEIANGIVDIIGYISVEFNEEGYSERYLYTRSTPNIFAGSRFKYLPDRIPFGYDELTNALADAIEKTGEIEGRDVLTDDKMVYDSEERSFTDVMKESKEIWLKLVDSADEDKISRAYEIIEKNFGKPMKLSEASEKQKEIVENIIAELKAL